MPIYFLYAENEHAERSQLPNVTKILNAILLICNVKYFSDNFARPIRFGCLRKRNIKNASAHPHKYFRLCTENKDLSLYENKK